MKAWPTTSFAPNPPCRWRRHFRDDVLGADRGGLFVDGHGSNNPLLTASGDHAFGDGGNDTIIGGAGADVLEASTLSASALTQTEDSQRGAAVEFSRHGPDRQRHRWI
ncbi:hypothetical protein ACFQU2_25140 [Siccirubricoccus deserti]|uniref:Calcium-binding protein n=1 Tax=Siccirubricoccus deserti TaxID=2013562 RepID=A0A9X0R5B8_9PROT|nr:hypothetical protein [Siccirubricoccus deserti]